MHQQRQAKIARLATTHRARMWRAMREDGWIFGEDDTRNEQTRSPDEAEAESGPMSDEDSDEPRLPQASYFSLESEVESGFDSDTPPPPSGVPEGPEAPPPTSRTTTPEIEQDTIPPEPTDPAMTPSLHLPSVQWSLHVSKIYLELVCSLFLLSWCTQRPKHPVRIGKLAGAACSAGLTRHVIPLIAYPERSCPRAAGYLRAFCAAFPRVSSCSHACGRSNT